MRCRNYYTTQVSRSLGRSCGDWAVWMIRWIIALTGIIMPCSFLKYNVCMIFINWRTSGSCLGGTQTFGRESQRLVIFQTICSLESERKTFALRFFLPDGNQGGQGEKCLWQIQGRLFNYRDYWLPPRAYVSERACLPCGFWHGRNHKIPPSHFC